MRILDYPPPPDWSRDISTIGVTGTNGKTTTTLFVAAALATLGRPVANITTLGHALDTELLDLEPEYESFLETMRCGHEKGGRFAAIELTSEALGSGFMAAWPCKIGVFTNLSHDHLAAHGSAEHYLASKAQLFVKLPPDGVAVLNQADPVSELLRDVLPERVNVVLYGPGADAEFRLLHSAPTWTGTSITLEARGQRLDFRIQTVGNVFAWNATAALAAAVAAGASAESAARAIALAPSVPGRFEVVARKPYAVVDYAHTPDALVRTLETARALGPRHVTLVLGAGGNTDRAKREPMGAAAAAADCVIVTSDNPRDEDPRAIAEDLCRGIGPGTETHVALDRGQAIRLALESSHPDDLVIVAGKGHETRQIVKGRALPFSDKEVIQSTLASLGGTA